MTVKNFKVSGTFFERVPRTSAELIQSLKSGLGCLDMMDGSIVGPSSVQIAADMTILAASVSGSALEDQPVDWGWFWRDLPQTPPVPMAPVPADYRNPSQVYIDQDGIAVGQALISSSVNDEVYGSPAAGGMTIGAQANQLIGSIPIIEDDVGSGPTPTGVGQGGAHLIITAPTVNLPEWFRKLPDDTEIVDAWMELRLGNISHLTIYEHYGILNGSEYSGGPSGEKAWATRKASVPDIGFALIGQSPNGQWNHLGSATDIASGGAASKIQNAVKCKTFFQMLLEKRNVRCKKLAVYPAIASSAASPETLDPTQNSAAGVLWSIWNAYQTNNKWSDYSAGGGGTLRFESESHILEFDNFSIGNCVVQFKLPDAFLKGIRINPGAWPAMVDAV